MPKKKPESDKETWNNVAEIWTAYQLSDHDMIRKHTLHRLIEKLEKSKFEQVLDLGCGPGVITHQLHSYCSNVSGIDFSSKMIEIAKEKFDHHRNIHFFLDDATQLESAPSNYFDLVVSIFSLQSMSDCKKVFKQVYRVCKRQGIFFFCLYYPGVFTDRYKPATSVRKSVTLDNKEVKLPIVWNLRGMDEPICTNEYYRPIQQYIKLAMDGRFGIDSLLCWDENGQQQAVANAEDPRIVELWLNK